MSGIVFASTAATLAHQGNRYRISPGEPWDADDPLVKRYPSMFVAAPSHVRTSGPGDYKPVDETPVERATRAPGEKRRIRRG